MFTGKPAVATTQGQATYAGLGDNSQWNSQAKRLGFVVDFIDVGPWPVFNMADSFITVGIATLAVITVLFPDKLSGESDDDMPVMCAKSIAICMVVVLNITRATVTL